MKKIILSLFLLASCPMISKADYGMIKLPAEEIIKQNNPTTLPQTSAQTTIKTASATTVPQQAQTAPALPQPSAIMAKLTGSFDDALPQVINLLSQKDFKILSYDTQKGFIIAQNNLTGDRIFSVLGTYNNQCFVKISCLSSSCSSMSKFGNM